MNINIPIEPKYIDVLRSNGVTNPIEHLQHVIDEYIEDMELAKIADKAYCEHLENPNNTITLEELKRELNL